MESLIPPFDAYRGDAPYIFVSYAHKDADAVFAHLTRLRQEGFRIWYDEGIDPGADWSDEIATALVHAEVFLTFVSKASVASNNVRKEIVFAIDQKKYMLCVHIEEADLPAGLKMQLGNIQALLENRFHDKDKFYERFFAALKPELTQGEDCGDSQIRYVRQRATVAEHKPFWAKYKKSLLAVACALLLGLATLGCYALLEQPQGGPVIADKNLEHSLREAMQIPRAAILESDFAAFTGQLDLSGRGITDISPLRHMTGLTMLNLENNSIADISPLANLKGVSVLGLANNKISDFTPIRGLGKSLIGLSIENNPAKDLSQLRGLTNLQVLDLTNVPITDLELGKYLRRLKVVILSESGHGLDSKQLWSFKADLPPNCEVKIEGSGK